jgi:hypothetical protein
VQKSYILYSELNLHKKILFGLSASIPKYVTDINGCSVQAVPGATIGRLSNLVANGTGNGNFVF